MNRLTHERSNGIKSGYWSPDKKQDLVNRLAEYENTDLTPQQIKDMQFCLREKSRECAELRRRIRELEGEAEGKKPEYINNGISVCRECGHKLKRCYDYCPNCGQAIQWDENLEGIKDGQM